MSSDYFSNNYNLFLLNHVVAVAVAVILSQVQRPSPTIRGLHMMRKMLVDEEGEKESMSTMRRHSVKSPGRQFKQGPMFRRVYDPIAIADK